MVLESLSISEWTNIASDLRNKHAQQRLIQSWLGGVTRPGHDGSPLSKENPTPPTPPHPSRPPPTPEPGGMSWAVWAEGGGGWGWGWAVGDGASEVREVADVA